MSGKQNPTVGLPQPEKPTTWKAAKKVAGKQVRKKKHKKIDKHHPEFELTYDMMLGIRTTVGQVEARPSRELTTHDFTDVTRLRFPSEGTSMTPGHAMRDFKFKDYSPEVFRQIRERFRIKPQDYLTNVCGDFQFLEFISNSKSGQFFFYTHDRQFMIKTVDQDESKFLRRILPAYYHHVMNNPNTLMTRIYGMHRVKPHKKKEMHFLIFGSVFHMAKYIHQTFDLKGSLQGRRATEKEKKQAQPVFKDQDFLDQNTVIRIGRKNAEALKEQIKRDVSFLANLDIMDYSLLLGIHNEGEEVHEAEPSRKAGAQDEKERLEATDNLGPIPDRTQFSRNSTGSTTAGTPYSYPSAATSTNSSFDSSDPEFRSGRQSAVSAVSTTSATSAPGVSVVVTSEDGHETTVAQSPSHHGLEDKSSDVEPEEDQGDFETIDDGQAQTAEAVQTAEEAQAAAAPAVKHSKSTPSKSQTTDSIKKKKSRRTQSRDDSALMTSSTVMHIRRPSQGTAEEDFQRMHTSPLFSSRPRKQSRYGLPTHYNKFTTPSDIGFVAPEFKSVNLPVYKDDKPQPAAKHSLFSRDDGGIRGVDEEGRPTDTVYYMGIIDILTLYNWKKRGEHAFKSLKYDSSTISAVKASKYAARFNKFMFRAIK